MAVCTLIFTDQGEDDVTANIVFDPPLDSTEPGCAARRAQMVGIRVLEKAIEMVSADMSRKAVA